MNKYLKRGLSAYMIFLRNKLAACVLMLMGGIMLTIGAFSGNGNDTKTLPTMIALAGSAFTLWGFYRIGYIRAELKALKDTDEEDDKLWSLIFQIGETAIYMAIAIFGLFLLMNEVVTNRLLNIMTGCFTILNGVVGMIHVIKKREKHATFGWKFMLGLAIIELTLGIYLLVMPDTVSNGMLGAVGIITIIAGIIEVILSLRRDVIEKTIQDGKDIVKTLKDEK